MIPFLKKAYHRSGCEKLLAVVHRRFNSVVLFYILYCICIPAMIAFSIYECFARIINLSFINANKDYKYELGIVAIAKNESEYIAEWIAFHIAVGVNHIYLYDNESTDQMPEIVNKFVKKGLVTYNIIRGEKQQGNAYNDALKRYSKDCKYLAFIDCDEYLLTVDPQKSIVNELDNLLNVSQKRGGVAINWVMYGSSNHISTPQGLCIESFVHRAQIGKKGTDIVKTIVRPECVKSYNHPHVPKYKIGFHSVNTLGERTDSWSNPVKEYESLRINHYFTKSKEQWIKRRALKRADTGTTRTLDEFYEHDNNDIFDNIALHYVDAVNKILNEVL